MNTDLVPVAPAPGTETALAQNGLLEGVGFDANVFELRPLNIEMTQRTSKGKVTPGLFRIKNTEDTFEELHVVVFGQSTPRVLYPVGSKPGEGASPLCRSRDGLVPITTDDRLQPQAANCKGCEHASWKQWNKTKQSEDKPPCQEKTKLFMIDRRDMIPYIIQLSGKSLSKNLREAQTWKAAAQQIALMQFRIKNQRKLNFNLFDFSMKLTPVEVGNKYGSSSFVVGFSDIAPIKDDDRAAFHELYRQYVLQSDRINSEAEARDAEEEIESAVSEPTSADQTANVNYEV